MAPYSPAGQRYATSQKCHFHPSTNPASPIFCFHTNRTSSVPQATYATRQSCVEATLHTSQYRAAQCHIRILLLVFFLPSTRRTPSIPWALRANALTPTSWSRLYFQKKKKLKSTQRHKPFLFRRAQNPSVYVEPRTETIEKTTFLRSKDKTVLTFSFFSLYLNFWFCFVIFFLFEICAAQQRHTTLDTFFLNKKVTVTNCWIVKIVHEDKEPY